MKCRCPACGAAFSLDVQRCAIQRKGRDWAVSKAEWQGALEIVLTAHDKGGLQLPLLDHAYLYEVLMRHANKTEGQLEQATEQQRKRDAQSRNPAAAAREVGGTSPTVDKVFTSVEEIIAEGKRRRAMPT